MIGFYSLPNKNLRRYSMYLNNSVSDILVHNIFSCANIYFLGDIILSQIIKYTFLSFKNNLYTCKLTSKNVQQFRCPPKLHENGYSQTLASTQYITLFNLSQFNKTLALVCIYLTLGRMNIMSYIYVHFIFSV